MANPRRASGAPTRQYKLVIAVTPAGLIEVKENPIGSMLPTFCPQRHMNSNGTFCLGLNAGAVILEAGKTDAWWKKLGVFLTCQETAHETRHWPDMIEISHGAAGETEVRAEDEAEKLGLLAEYQMAVREDRGPIADAVKRIRETTGLLVNGRAECVCGRTNKRGDIRLRRRCWKANDLCLPVEEARRRKQEKEFWQRLKRAKQPCCGTMDDCPLQVNGDDSFGGR